MGSALVDHLERTGHEVCRVMRGHETRPGVCSVPSIDGTTDWKTALSGVDAVVHCAARAHRMNEPGDCLDKYASVNTEGTVNLAQWCVRLGVRRLIYVSTIKVCAEQSESGRPIGPDAAHAPQDDYSRTKADAEVALQRIAEESKLEIVVVRPPLVYGPNAKGNLKLLVNLLAKRVPLPFGAIKNKRSIVGLDNLVDFLTLTVHHPDAAGRIFNVSDDEALSTPAILRTLAHAMNKQTLLLPIPVPALTVAARLIGKGNYLDRLCTSLEVDSRNCFELLKWKPPLTAQESIASLVRTQQNKAIIRH